MRILPYIQVMGSVQRKFGEMEQAKSAKLVKFSGELPKILADGLVDIIAGNYYNKFSL